MKNFKLYNIKKNMKLYGLITTLSLTSLTGCSKNNNNYTSEVTTKYIESTTTEEMTTEEITTEEVTTEESKSKDDIIKDFIKTQKEDLQYVIEVTKLDELASKGKSLTITLIDFIFYGGEIKGITYNELSEGVKEQIYQDFCDIDALIEKHVPGYKEAIGEKYEKVKDFIGPKYEYVKDKVTDFVGEDNIEKLGEIKDDAGEVVSDLWNKGKTKVKEKYEKWRDN